MDRNLQLGSLQMEDRLRNRAMKTLLLQHLPQRAQRRPNVLNLRDPSLSTPLDLTLEEKA